MISSFSKTCGRIFFCRIRAGRPTAMSSTERALTLVTRSTLALVALMAMAQTTRAECEQLNKDDLTTADLGPAAPNYYVDGTGPDEALMFIDAVARDGITAIADRGASNFDRHIKLRHTYDAAFATEDIARLAVGRYWRDVSEDERTEIANALGDYFADTLIRYLPGGTFQVKSAEQIAAEEEIKAAQRPRGPMGLIAMFVHTVFVSENVSSPVMWSVAKVDCQLKVVDVAVNGRSLVLAQRDNVEASMRRNNGSVDALIADMQHFSPFDETISGGPDFN